MSEIPTYDFDTYVDRFGFVYAASPDIAKNAEKYGLKFIRARTPQPTEVEPLPPPPNVEDPPTVEPEPVAEAPAKKPGKTKTKTEAEAPAAPVEPAPVVLQEDLDAQLNDILNS